LLLESAKLLCLHDIDRRASAADTSSGDSMVVVREIMVGVDWRVSALGGGSVKWAFGEWSEVRYEGVITHPLQVGRIGKEAVGRQNMGHLEIVSG
jgi:hypothetical protein